MIEKTIKSHYKVLIDVLWPILYQCNKSKFWIYQINIFFIKKEIITLPHLKL